MSLEAELEKKRKQLQKAYRLVDMFKGSGTHWCPIVSSAVIRKEFITRCNDLGVSVFEVAIRADVSYNSVKKFWLKLDEPKSRPSLRAEDIIKMGELVGIKIRTSVIVGDINEIDRSKLLNDKFIPHARRKKNKKLG